MKKIFKLLEKKLSLIKSWILENKREAFFLFVILCVASFLRFYRLSEYLTFLGDEGRDVIVVRKLLVEGDPILVGPGTSIGNMYLGPLYYYMMAIPLFLANYSPVGPAAMVAALGVLTVFFVWFVARRWFGKTAAFISSFLYAISPTIIIYSRSSWNPNIMPFFALLVVYSIWKVWYEKETSWIIVVALSFAFTLQSHYLGLLLAPVIGIYTFLAWKKTRKKDGKRKRFNKALITGSSLFAILMSPLVIFDARHGWRNFTAMYEFFSKRQTTVSAKPWKAIPKIPELLNEISTRLMGARIEETGKWIVIAIVIFAVYVFLNRKKLRKIEISGYTIVLAWLAFALVGLGLYKQEIYDHYYGFFFAAPFILIGGLTERAYFMSKNFGKSVVVILLAALVYINVIKSPVLKEPNNQLPRTINVAGKVMEEAGDDPFNIAVIAERNYEGAYLYFLEKDGAPVVAIDAQREKETVADQLFVICELPHEECGPTTSPKAEVANFGWSDIENEWEVEGIFIFRLIHTK